MGGPSDSGSDDAPSDEFKLTPLDFGATPSLSQRFRLKMMWDTPRLEWRPVKGQDKASPSAPPPPAPPDPEGAFDKFDRYLRDGGYLFDLSRADWGPTDRAFQFAPTDPPNYVPTLAQILAWRDQEFYGRLGGAPTSLMFGPSAPMSALTPPSLFYKPPPTPPLYGEPSLSRPGKVGDALKAVWNLPVTQRLYKLAGAELARQFDSFEKNDWDTWSGWRKATAIGFSGLFVAGAVGAAAGVSDLRHFTADKLLGVDIPVYLINQRLSVFRVPGTYVKIDGFGAASDFLVGPAADPARPREFKITVMVDLREAFHVVAAYF